MENCVNETIVHPSNESLSSHINTLNHVINDIALPAVCVFGIFGNLLNLTILTRRKLQKSFRSLEQAANLCLIALAVSDLMFCVLALLTTFLPADNIYDQQGVLFFYGLYSYFFINVFIMESTMLTVAMSLERYMAICFPLRQDLYLTTRKIKYIIVSTFIFSLLFNIPVLWRFETNPLCFNTTIGGVSEDGERNINFSQAIRRIVSHKGDNLHEGEFEASEFSPLSRSLSSPFSLSSSPSSSSSSLTSAERVPLSKQFSDSSYNKSPGIPLQNASASGQSFFSTSTVASASPSSYALLTTPSWEPAMRYKIQEAEVNETEKMAYRLAWALVGNVIPLILLFVFNVCLCRKIYLSYKMRRQFKRQSRAKSSSHILTLTLVVIVVMFFILVAPSELLLLVSDASPTVEPILNFMQSLNFSVNFILYCIISPYFRKNLKYILMCGCYNIYQTSRDWKKEFETSLM